MWFDYNLPYANVDEPRNNWRPFLLSKVAPLVKSLKKNENATISDVVSAVNKGLWEILGAPGKPIVFKSSQTPLIYDPMSTIIFGYASCTGISILFVDALRSVGVCARIAGTPSWHNNPSEGNHNWIEVLIESKTDSSGYKWGIIEGSPDGPGETLTNPCDKWFCNSKHFGEGKARTPVYAARFDRLATSTNYPMSWDTSNLNIPGVD